MRAPKFPLLLMVMLATYGTSASAGEFLHKLFGLPPSCGNAAVMNELHRQNIPIGAKVSEDSIAATGWKAEIMYNNRVAKLKEQQPTTLHFPMSTRFCHTNYYGKEYYARNNYIRPVYAIYSNDKNVLQVELLSEKLAAKLDDPIGPTAIFFNYAYLKYQKDSGVDINAPPKTHLPYWQQKFPNRKWRPVSRYDADHSQPLFPNPSYPPGN